MWDLKGTLRLEGTEVDEYMILLRRGFLVGGWSLWGLVKGRRRKMEPVSLITGSGVAMKIICDGWWLSEGACLKLRRS